MPAGAAAAAPPWGSRPGRASLISAIDAHYQASAGIAEAPVGELLSFHDGGVGCVRVLRDTRTTLVAGWVCALLWSLKT